MFIFAVYHYRQLLTCSLITTGFPSEGDGRLLANYQGCNKNIWAW
jgi:hypothetical protein